MMDSIMDGHPYKAARFAATLRRRLYRGKMAVLIVTHGPELFIAEHLGLIEPQHPSDRPDLFMRPAPIPNEDETHLPEDAAVADPLADETLDLLYNTARKNREIFTELFRPVPTNLVRSWSAYEVSNYASDAGRRVAHIETELRAQGEDGTCRAGHSVAAGQGTSRPGQGFHG